MKKRHLAGIGVMEEAAEAAAIEVQSAKDGLPGDDEEEEHLQENQGEDAFAEETPDQSGATEDFHPGNPERGKSVERLGGRHLVLVDGNDE